MTNEEIDKEIKRLEELRIRNNIKTRDGVPIEIGKTYYLLYNLTDGFETISPQNDWHFDDFSVIDSIRNKSYSYCRIFSTKEAAYKWMEQFLIATKEGLENQAKNNQVSLELLRKLNYEES